MENQLRALGDVFDHMGLGFPVKKKTAKIFLLHFVTDTTLLAYEFYMWLEIKV